VPHVEDIADARQEPPDSAPDLGRRARTYIRIAPSPGEAG